MAKVTHLYGPLSPADKFNGKGAKTSEPSRISMKVRPSQSQAAYNRHNPIMSCRRWVDIDQYIRQNTTGYGPSQVSYEATIRVHNTRNDKERRVDQKTGKYNTSMAAAMRKAGLIN